MRENGLARARGNPHQTAGVADYWIIDLVDGVLEVYRDPAAEAGRPYGWRYASAVTLRAGDSVAALAAPASGIALADLLL